MSNKNASDGSCAVGFKPQQLLALSEAYIKHCIENERLPNLAGLCRYLDISVEAFGQLPESYHEQVALILDALEDEALNSSKPAALLNGYLKKRLGYDEATEHKDEGELIVVFDHDANTDGE